MSETPTPTPSESGPSRPASTKPQAWRQNQKLPKAPKKELKVLMLHGYTQSGPLFRAKTRALEKLLAKALNAINTSLTFVYPTGPIRLRPSDIPGFVPPADVKTDADAEDELDSWAWFRRDAASPAIFGLDVGMKAVAQAIKDAGGVDGVVGFSQGGAMAAMVASALEEPRRTPPESAREWAEALREANGGEAMKFAVVYSGFYMPVDEIKWMYEPSIRTPTLHYIGGLDTVVEEARSRGLIERCIEPMEALHPGGHYVPITREWMMPITGFIKKFAGQLEEKESPKLA
ncbi:hypothetical protein jhhlp_004201 [Lomentospora prolificans]|uniref:Serine hydrolase domain-containing protein n=1 Tax=Lomentospora prolificans TaxID=41688 RepID=A0A2N3NAY5_9PEZI|nr:hypothetical protein jhhlp_004201 [Lomentospora prolificans]